MPLTLPRHRVPSGYPRGANDVRFLFPVGVGTGGGGGGCLCPLPQGGEGVARQKIAVFPAAPCRLVGSGERLARPRGERRCGTGSHPQGQGVPRRSAEGLLWLLLGEEWGASPELLPPSAERRELLVFGEEGSAKALPAGQCSTAAIELLRESWGRPSPMLHWANCDQALEDQRCHQFLPGQESGHLAPPGGPGRGSD